MFKEFLKYIHPKLINTINKRDILAFQNHLVADKKVSRSYQNQSINAIKFYLEKILGYDRQFFELERPRKTNSLPVVLSKKEINTILRQIRSLKHAAIISTIYGTGLRISELQGLEIKDIDSQNNRIWVRNGKGEKDRVTLLPDNLLILLRAYYRQYKPKKWLFEGPNNRPYSTSSIRKIFHRACSKAGILKKVKVHTLRHSFATHLMESGVNLRYIQSLLGHTSSKTTEIYTHVCSHNFSDISSPIESLDSLGIFER